jgi:hypothetical protein
MQYQLEHEDETVETLTLTPEEQYFFGQLPALTKTDRIEIKYFLEIVAYFDKQQPCTVA